MILSFAGHFTINTCLGNLILSSAAAYYGSKTHLTYLLFSRSDHIRSIAIVSLLSTSHTMGFDGHVRKVVSGLFVSSVHPSTIHYFFLPLYPMQCTSSSIIRTMLSLKHSSSSSVYRWNRRFVTEKHFHGFFSPIIPLGGNKTHIFCLLFDVGSYGEIIRNRSGGQIGLLESLSAGCCSIIPKWWSWWWVETIWLMSLNMKKERIEWRRRRKEILISLWVGWFSIFL